MEIPFVTKDMLLGDIVKKYPEAAEIMLSYGLHCVGCFANAFDTVEIGAKVHRMSDEKLEKMMEEVNEVIKSKWKNQSEK